MGIGGSPDIFQAKMSELMMTLEYVKTYLDNLLIITKSKLIDHLDKLKEVLTKLQSAGLKINSSKSTFCTFETEYLGYTLTKKGIKPHTNRIDSILALKPPTKVKELRTFPGMVQYYQDMWRSLSKMLTPLTDLVGECGTTKVTKANGTEKALWHWDDCHQKAFDRIKATIAQDVVLAYLDFSKPFEIFTDA